MAAVDAKNLSAQEHDELCCVYAALVLHDAGLEITVTSVSTFLQEEIIGKLIKASGNTTEPYYPMVFAKALHGEDINGILNTLGGAAPHAAAAAEKPAEKKKGMRVYNNVNRAKEGAKEGRKEGGKEGRRSRCWRIR